MRRRWLILFLLASACTSSERSRDATTTVASTDETPSREVPSLSEVRRGWTDRSAQKLKPAVTVRSEEKIAKFLRWEEIAFDEPWSPSESAVARASLALKPYLETHARTGPDSPEYREVLRNLGEYHLEFGGFRRGDAAFVVGNMYVWDDEEAEEEDFPDESRDQFSIIMDGGTDVVVFVFDLGLGKIVSLRWNGDA